MTEAVRVGALAAFVVVSNSNGVVVVAGATDVAGAVVVEDSVSVFGQVFTCRAGVVRPV